jgi:hypothetical protein
VDGEGGDVTRLHALTGSPVLGPAALGAADDRAPSRPVVLRVRDAAEDLHARLLPPGSSGGGGAEEGGWDR